MLSFKNWGSCYLFLRYFLITCESTNKTVNYLSHATRFSQSINNSLITKILYLRHCTFTMQCASFSLSVNSRGSKSAHKLNSYIREKWRKYCIFEKFVYYAERRSYLTSNLIYFPVSKNSHFEKKKNRWKSINAKRRNKTINLSKHQLPIIVLEIRANTKNVQASTSARRLSEHNKKSSTSVKKNKTGR